MDIKFYKERKMKTRKMVLLLVLPLLLFPFYLGAAGQREKGKEGEAKAAEIVFFNFSAAPVAGHQEDMKKLVDIFEEQNRGIDVKLETAPFSEYFTKLQTLIAGGLAPDVFELNYENFVNYASKGVLLDMSSLADSDSTFTSDIFYPRAYNAFNYKGMQLGLPESFSTVVLFYNKDLFDQAGVGYPKEDWTWEEAIVAAKKITNREKGIWGLNSGIQFWEFYKKVAQNGGSLFNEEKTEVTIDAPENVEALEMMVSLVKEHGVMPSEAERGGVPDEELFKSGKLAMYVSGIWMFDVFKALPFSWDIQVEPGMKRKATHFFANAVSIFAATRHRDAAWKWARFLTSSPEMAKIRIETGWELPALTNKEYLKGYLEKSPPQNRDVVFKSLEYAIVPPVIERQNEMQDIINQAIEHVSLGKLSPKEALAQADAKVEKLLK
ncbi:MAG: sugar ABC transporter substrate-binding protein [Spirochaetes bacterium]|nr:MAG: sugar ABC transporter substrate-binding protein [Spirochaetota bacterium]